MVAVPDTYPKIKKVVQNMLAQDRLSALDRRSAVKNVQLIKISKKNSWKATDR